MFELKQLSETQVSTYVTTPLFFQGSQYSIDGLDEYMEMLYTPLTDRIEASDTTCTTSEGYVVFKATSVDYTTSMTYIEEIIGLLRESTTYHYDNVIEFSQGTDDNGLWFLIAQTKIRI